MKKFTLVFLALVCSFSMFGQSFDDRTKGMQHHAGFLPFLWDAKTGKLWLSVPKDRLDSEFLYQTSLPAGLGSNDVGLDRSLLGHTAIVKFSRAGNKLLLIEPNYNFRAVTNDAAERRAVEQSFAQSVLAGFTIEAENGGSILVDATNFLLRDAMDVAGRLRGSNQGSYSVDASRSAVFTPACKSFPLNTELEATVTFANSDGRPGAWVSGVTPSSQAVTLRIHHSFVQLPDRDYEPRSYDARSGFIPTDYFDYSTPVSEPIDKFFIIRHRLKKKDPTAAVSEPVKPIVYYLDNGTPEPIRSALLEGARWWSQAFEAAGFRNAFKVEVLPDTADPMDIRYNMINWVHRATRGWSFGAAVTDPRTGEIIKGNVTLGSLRVRQDYLIAQGLLSPFKDGQPADDKMLRMALQRLKHLAAHEVGHTLGLMHNYIASTQDRASVMDYPPPTVKLTDGRIDLSDAYTNSIGEWDKVAINYGYREFAPGTDQRASLDRIITDAAGRGLTLISDRDARDPAGLHPTAHLWDFGKDPVSALKDAVAIRKTALENFGLNSIRRDTPVALLEEVLVPVYLFHRYQLEAVTKQVGGMYYSYAVKGDGQTVTRPLTRQEQLNALEAVEACMDPKTLTLSENIVRLIPPRPAGYDYHRELFKRRTGLSFDPLAAAETAADMPLSFLFNVSRLNRMAEYGVENNGLSVTDLVASVMSKTWNAPRLRGFEGLVQQQNEQLVLTYLLAASISANASFATRAAVSVALDDLKKSVNKALPSSSAERRGYLLLTLERMKAPDKAQPTQHIAQPPGSPIGAEMLGEEEF